MFLEGLQLGNYKIVKFLKKGGMGEVYQGEDHRISREVAIKVVRTEASSHSNPKVQKEINRAKREIVAITKLNHPHILHLYDFGEHPLNGDILTYMVMPYHPDGSLEDWLHKRGPTALSPDDVAYFLDQAADALQCAHDHHIIHQDVKPSNFLVSNKTSLLGSPLPNLHLADFGIARFTTATTSLSQNVGTPAYMPPEQWEATAQPTAANDQYALAIMAYQLLTGQLPFTGTVVQLMRQHAFEQPKPPSELNKQLSPAIDAVILQALEKDPKRRFPSIAAFAQAFKNALGKNSGPVVKLDSTQLVHPRPISLKNAGLLLLVVLFLAASTYGVVTFGIPAIDSVIATNNQHATATSVAATQTHGAQANGAGSVAATGTARTKASATARASAVAATGTAQASATAVANATATANVRATATASAYPMPTYILLSAKGTLLLSDPLQDNSKGYGWSNSGSCQFTSGTYHASTPGQLAYCNGSASNVSHLNNIIVEVQMTIVRGDCGGIVFRANPASNSYYAFEVCQDGSYTLSSYANNQVSGGQAMMSNTSTSIKKGYNQTNVLDVVANSREIALYVNGQWIPGTNDTTYTSGGIGVLADAVHGHATDVAYSNLKVWTLA